MRPNLRVVKYLEGVEEIILFVKNNTNVSISKEMLYKYTYTMYGLDAKERTLWYKENKMSELYAEYLSLLVRIDNRPSNYGK